jgi:hypothetical protein
MKTTLISFAAAATLAVSALAITPAAAAPAIGIGIKAPAGNVELAHWRRHHHRYFWGYYPGYRDCFSTRRGYVCWY